MPIYVISSDVAVEARKEFPECGWDIGLSSNGETVTHYWCRWNPSKDYEERLLSYGVEKYDNTPEEVMALLGLELLDE